MEKDTVYIDVDDEITSVIDKVISSKAKTVALVLPKRASVFQSVVNMKLLKRKSDQNGKKVILVTTESSLLPLAGATGLLVSKTLASTPEIPDGPLIVSREDDIDEDAPIEVNTEPKRDFRNLKDAKNILKRPVGALDDEAKLNSNNEIDEDLNTIDIEDISKDQDEPEYKPSRKEKKHNKKKDHALSVPDFDTFKKYGFLGVIGIIVLVIASWYLFTVLPTATIIVATNAQSVNANLSFSLSTSANTLDSTNNVLPAKQVTLNNNYTASVPATGQANNGNKANGTATLSITKCTSGAPPVLPAFVGITHNKLTYITQKSTSWNTNNISLDGNGCYVFQASNSTSIIAQNGGSNYNVSDASLSGAISGYPVSGTGSVKDGTDNMVTVASQGDINSATTKLNQNNDTAKSKLQDQLTQGNYYPLPATFVATPSDVTPNVSAGTQTNTVTVSESVNFVMYGVKQADLVTILEKNINSQANNQSILDNGITNANIALANGSTDTTHLTIQANAAVGPALDVNKIKIASEGQKSQVIKQNITADPNVTNVTIKYSPFYVSQAPSNPAKITVTVLKPTRSN